VFPCGSEGAAAAFGLAAGRDAVIEEALWRPTAPQKTQFGRSSADLKNAKSGNRLFAAPNFGSAAQCSPPLPKHLLPGVDAAAREQLASACWEALREAAAEQARHQAATEPTARALELLRALLTSGRAHLEARGGGKPDRSPESCGWRLDSSGNWSPLGDCIGWVDGDDLYLEPAAFYRLVQVAGRDSGEGLPASLQILKKRLHEKGLLASVDDKRQTLTVRKRIGGCSKDVLHLLRHTVLPEEPEEPEIDNVHEK
jgi:hypothetical protein